MDIDLAREAPKAPVSVAPEAPTGPDYQSITIYGSPAASLLENYGMGDEVCLKGEVCGMSKEGEGSVTIKVKTACDSTDDEETEPEEEPSEDNTKEKAPAPAKPTSKLAYSRSQAGTLGKA
jgi:hypothetical protein